MGFILLEIRAKRVSMIGCDLRQVEICATTHGETRRYKHYSAL